MFSFVEDPFLHRPVASDVLMEPRQRMSSIPLLLKTADGDADPVVGQSVPLDILTSAGRFQGGTLRDN